MSLYVRRKEGETWRECVARYAGRHGLATECLDIFDQEVGKGVPGGKAAWDALCEWDCLDFRDDDVNPFI
ncbi:MAG TPA: hypothetical protein VEA36_03710 [Candidatus Paceibacterota bacterium]|nr:hypothetical protein [Candidatus Paceibacterota bacterium]